MIGNTDFRLRIYRERRYLERREYIYSAHRALDSFFDFSIDDNREQIFFSLEIFLGVRINFPPRDQRRIYQRKETQNSLR